MIFVIEPAKNCGVFGLFFNFFLFCLIWIIWEPESQWICAHDDNRRVSVPRSKSHQTRVFTMYLGPCSWMVGKKLFHGIYLATREASKQLGRMFPFFLYAPSSFLGFLGWEGSCLGLQSFLFSSLIPFPGCFSSIYLFIFLSNYLNLLKLPLHFGLVHAGCFSFIYLFIFLWNYLNLIKACPSSLWFGPCRLFFLDLFIYLFS